MNRKERGEREEKKIGKMTNSPSKEGVERVSESTRITGGGGRCQAMAVYCHIDAVEERMGRFDSGKRFNRQEIR